MPFTSVDHYLAAQTPEARDAVRSLRALVLDAEPGLEEIIKWNSPSYVFCGEDRLTVNVGPTGAVRLILHRGTGIAETKGAASGFDGDPTGLLTWHSDVRASLPAGADAAAARAVLRAWLVTWP